MGWVVSPPRIELLSVHICPIVGLFDSFTIMKAELYYPQLSIGLRINGGVACKPERLGITITVHFPNVSA